MSSAFTEGSRPYLPQSGHTFRNRVLLSAEHESAKFCTGPRQAQTLPTGQSPLSISEPLCRTVVATVIS